jgi:hypothetical protein
MIKNSDENFKKMQKFMEGEGTKALSDAVEIYNKALKDYTREKGLGIEFIINGNVSLCMTQLNHTIKAAVTYAQHMGATKAQVYELRQELSNMLKSISDEFVTDEWYKYEEHMQ